MQNSIHEQNLQSKVNKYLYYHWIIKHVVSQPTQSASSDQRHRLQHVPTHHSLTFTPTICTKTTNCFLIIGSPNFLNVPDSTWEDFVGLIELIFGKHNNMHMKLILN